MKFITIDGSQGEGGGQILRSALSLSSITGKPFTIKNIRSGRVKPGLMRQHLTAVQSVASLCDAQVKGDELLSQELGFKPGKIVAGQYRFDIGTAGSTSLILQTILPVLAFAEQESCVILTGGTHNPFAPTYDYLQECFLPHLRAMGFEIDLRIKNAGFYPAGGGEIELVVRPIRELKPLSLLDRGSFTRVFARACCAKLDDSILERELKLARKELELDESAAEKVILKDTLCAGNVFYIRCENENNTTLFTSFGIRGITAEKVAKVAVKEAKRYLGSIAPADDYLADQLLIPVTIVGSGSFRTTSLSEHFQSNMQLIQKFVDVEINVKREDRLVWLVEIERKESLGK